MVAVLEFIAALPAAIKDINTSLLVLFQCRLLESVDDIVAIRKLQPYIPRECSIYIYRLVVPSSHGRRGENGAHYVEAYEWAECLEATHFEALIPCSL